MSDNKTSTVSPARSSLPHSDASGNSRALAKYDVDTEIRVGAVPELDDDDPVVPDD